MTSSYRRRTWLWVGLGASLLVASWAWGGTIGERPTVPEKGSHVALVSDCLTLLIRPELIDSVGWVPEPSKLPNGQESYFLTLQVGPQFYRFCYASAQARDAAWVAVRERLNGT